MKLLIKKLPPFLEFFIVIFITLGNLIISSTSAIISHISTDRALNLNFQQFSGLLTYEILTLCLVFLFLKARGWKIKDFNLDISLNLIGAGVVIFAIDYILVQIIATILIRLNIIIYPQLTCSLSFLEILAVSIVNPVFEEIIVIGYVFKALEKKYRGWLIIIISTLIRLSYHTYQGSIIIAGILPMGILFSLFYWRSKKLFPLIIAHGLLDFVPLYYCSFIQIS
ncbi:MAG: type II CAAX endopeptidase family protein [Prochloraceae cyanobacterium]|nr:type II CAAX endopeptidase family protein [Prochloraceae cyanobacterium]